MSSTGDPEGEIAETGVVPAGELLLPPGLVRQRPPAYSAVKVGGRRAYELARAGATPELAEREIEIHAFTELSRDGDRRSYVIECSSGTYVRSLIAELGDAYCESLRRTRIGDFDVAEADPERPIELNAALAFLPELRLHADAARQRHTASRSRPLTGPARVRLTDADGLIALAVPAPSLGR